jgi:uncharacterized protein
MIRLAALLALFAAPAFALDDEEYLRLCEPKTIATDRSLLSDNDWSSVDELAETVPNGIGRLWRIETPRGAVSYLWGTYHSSDIRISNLPDEVEYLIADARLVLLERVASDLSLREMRDQWDWGFFYDATDESVLHELPDPAIRAAYERIMRLGLTESLIEQLNPKYALVTLLDSICNDRLGTAGYPIQDMRIELLAADAGARIKPLDNRDVIDALANEPRWHDSFISTLTLYALSQTVPEATSTFFDLYQKGEIARLGAFERVLLQSRFPDIDIAATLEGMEDYLIDHRNAEMARRAMPDLEKGDVIIAVGCYHLVGETGLVALLRDAGMKVERVLLPGETKS